MKDFFQSIPWLRLFYSSLIFKYLTLDSMMIASHVLKFHGREEFWEIENKRAINCPILTAIYYIHKCNILSQWSLMKNNLYHSETLIITADEIISVERGVFLLFNYLAVGCLLLISGVWKRFWGFTLTKKFIMVN